jgi:hypothetical protein
MATLQDDGDSDFLPSQKSDFFPSNFWLTLSLNPQLLFASHYRNIFSFNVDNFFLNFQLQF